MKPRQYQIDAVKAASLALAKERQVLIVAPTASGKSLLVAMMVEQALQRNPHIRILVLCHQGHLLSQNEERIHQKCGDVDTGIYCASEGRKDLFNQIMLASRDSLGRNPEILGEFDLIIVDEAHLIDVKAGTKESDTFYSRIIKCQKDPFVVGLTGTPWRLSNGSIVGPKCFFKTKAFEIKMDFLIKEGFLCPYSLPLERKTFIDVEGLKVSSRGDYNEKELEEVSATAQVVEQCLDNWEREASNRKVSLFFCCSRIHAGLVKQHLMRRISSSEILYIDGDLIGNERKLELQNIKDGCYRAIVNIGVLTTGFDAPSIDCIVLLRATASAALFVQACGRGLRISPGKVDCLILDMAGNFDRFKSLSDPFVRDNKKNTPFLDSLGSSEARFKECPSCGEKVAPAATQCVGCFHIFINHSSEMKSSGSDLLHKVLSVHFEDKQTKAGDWAKVVHYNVGLFKWHSQYLLIERKQAFAKRHREIWRQLSVSELFPEVIRVIRKPGEKYTNINVIKWGVRNDPSDKCPHMYVENIFNKGSNSLVCTKCGHGLI